MNNERHNKTLRDHILESIKIGKMTMRPRWYFILRGALFGFGLAAITLGLVYIISFIIFVLHRNGVWFLPSFGFKTLGLVLVSLPWLLIFVTLVFVAILEIFVRHYAFAYRRPLLYSAFAIIALVIAGGFIVAETPLHLQFYRLSREGRLPFADQLYKGFGGERFEHVHPCQVTEIPSENILTCQEMDGDVFQIVITPDTRFPLGTDFSVDDRVLVIGQRGTSSITAEGIRKIDPTDGMVPGHGLGPRPQLHFK
jgi:hypothetical protein